jgi:hypothetical protein
VAGGSRGFVVFLSGAAFGSSTSSIEGVAILRSAKLLFVLAFVVVVFAVGYSIPPRAGRRASGSGKRNLAKG